MAILKIFGEDHVGLVNEITEVISKNMNVNIQGINISGNDGIFEGKISVTIKNNLQLQKLSDSIKKVKGIKTVDRIYKH